MSRLTVVMPDEVGIKSLSYLQTVALATDAQVPVTNVPEQKIRRMILNVRALFDGRQFSIPRDELIELHHQIYGYQDLTLVPSNNIALELGLYFWPTIVGPTASQTHSPFSGTALSTVFSFHNTSSGTISRYIWDFGDKSHSYSSTAKHIYAVAGTYTVTLTVSNPFSTPSSVSFTVTVAAPSGSGGTSITTETGTVITTENGDIIIVEP